ncbi:hypothetical protein Tco_1114271 [Tanacetum coccineum]|uniref:Uncharacterized protein n=1 Tax=Tanacetum coccineum TaxID=301880 RepID=A0ABQ5IXK4_9ASTR
MDEQSHYKQDKTITRQSINVKRHIFNVIGGTEEFEERDLNIGGDYGFDVTPLESTVGHIQGVTDGSSLGAILNHFTGKFDLSPSSQTANKTAEQKEKSCIAAATVVCYLILSFCNMVPTKITMLWQDTTFTCLRWSLTILQSFLSPLQRKTSKKVTASVGTDHRKAVVVIVIKDTESQQNPFPLMVPQHSNRMWSNSVTNVRRRVQTDRPVLNAAINQTTNHAHGTSGERSSSVHTKGKS